MTPASSPKLSDVIVQDFWVHVAGLIAIGLGGAAWYLRTKFQTDPSSLELMFMLGGFGTMGVKLINGSAAQLRQAALDTAFSASRAAQAAASAAQVATAPITAPPSLTPASAAAPQVSPDGLWIWNGSQWVPATPPAAPAQGGSTNG